VKDLGISLKTVELGKFLAYACKPLSILVIFLISSQNCWSIVHYSDRISFASDTRVLVEVTVVQIYKPGKKIGKYTITEDLNHGMMAISYAATGPDEQKVFLKHYKSPTTSVSWYYPYIAYQKELRSRIERSPCQNFCYKFMDSFLDEKNSSLFQVFEFLNKSDSMQGVLEKSKAKPASINADQWLLMAKVLVGGMAQLHKAQIVHADLKPDNIMLIHDPTLIMKYRLRIIDLDFSILTDLRAPWHGHSNYFGTPGYLSPEHLRGEVPKTASDMFTLGLMLHELLGGCHPYPAEDGSAAEKRVLSYSAQQLKPRSGLERLPNILEISNIIHQCLAPNFNDRPSAATVQNVLNNEKHITPPPNPLHLSSLVLVGPNGKTITTTQSIIIGRALVRNLGDDFRFFDHCQFRLVRAEVNEWYVEHISSAPNSTLLNGKNLTTRTKLSDGDVLAVGKIESRVIKLPMSVKIN
jgi:serine/threonine protein kinase